jgi:hypothetical protein
MPLIQHMFCSLCRSEVEDEFHFSMICDKLKDIRDKFFQKLTDIVIHSATKYIDGQGRCLAGAVLGSEI